jgi:hypothetical protein
MAGESRCKKCRELIVWATTAAGKNIPLDPVPVLGGNLEKDHDEVRYVTPDPEVRRYVSHFSTCPAAASFRRSRGRK